ncbi:response regulator transcription factor [Methylococcus sp. EFPC2]|uniref:response regulator n=1 Tax=Methylococcus sp. EFPC2 TaxID=2812648 RepID=UPI0019673972|nr:response regulator transcription factor [Methylococcus sp. EFPC2]QSA99057.1 response regulator transcription factor [Methylococcus sp. EFPC2]
MAATIDILFVDDHAIVREGYRALLGKQPGMRVIAEADSGAEAYRQFTLCNPDVVVTDITMAGSSGLELIARVRLRRADARILVFSMHQNPTFALQAIRAGALGYVSKSSPPEELLRAIREVHVGRHALSADMAQALALEKLGCEHKALESLTAREFEILRLLTDGRSTDAIAACLNLSPKTVCNCHYIIKRKLGVSSDIELMRLAIKLDVVDLLQGSANP